MDKSKLELSVGITSIIGIVMLILGVLWGKDVGFASKQRQVYFSFANSGGLRPGDPVHINGVKKGRVDEILLRQDHVMIATLLDDDITLFDDTHAQIGMQDLMGGHKMEISPGVSGQPLLTGGIDHPVTGSSVVGIAEMFAEAYSLKPKVDTLLVTMQKSMAELSQLLDRDKLRQPLHRSVQNLDEVSTELNQLLSETKPRLRGTLTHMHSVSQTMDTLLTANRSAIQSSLAGLAQVTAKMDTMTTSLQDMLFAIQGREGTVGKLVYDDAIFERLQHTVSGMDSLTVELRQSLGKYLNGVDIKLLNLIDF